MSVAAADGSSKGNTQHMNTRRIVFLLVIVFVVSAFKNDMPAYHIFNEKGNKQKYRKLIREIKDADVVFFGELHDNPIAHWLQIELTKSLYEERQGNIILGAEMFESDNQLIVDEYLSGVIRQKDFEREARLWPNYETDYKALMQFAADSGLHFVATNIPRRYAALVNKKGLLALDSLSGEAKKWIAPLPIAFDSTLSGYQEMQKMMKGMGGHGNMNIVEAQAIKDATMAYHIAENMKPGHLFLHFNGAFHTKNFEGIVWYLKQMHPGLTIKTIHTVEQEDIGKLNENLEGIADFVVVVDENMTKTY